MKNNFTIADSVGKDKMYEIMMLAAKGANEDQAKLMERYKQSKKHLTKDGEDI